VAIDFKAKLPEALTARDKISRNGHRLGRSLNAAWRMGSTATIHSPPGPEGEMNL
jgi:hypothetical protein